MKNLFKNKTNEEEIVKVKAIVPTTIKDGFDTVYGRVGNLTSLTTTSKDNLVNAINEIDAKPNGKTYTGGKITRTAATQDDEKIIVTDTVITADLLKIPSEAGGIVKSVGITLDVDTDGKLTNKFLSVSGTQNDEVDIFSTTSTISASGNIKAIEVGQASDSTSGIRITASPLGDTDITDKKYSDAHLSGKVIDVPDQNGHIPSYNAGSDSINWIAVPAGATYTGSNPIEIDNSNNISLKLDDTQFTIDADKGLTLNASGINTIVAAYLNSDVGKAVITTIVKAIEFDVEDPNS